MSILVMPEPSYLDSKSGLLNLSKDGNMKQSYSQLKILDKLDYINLNKDKITFLLPKMGWRTLDYPEYFKQIKNLEVYTNSNLTRIPEIDRGISLDFDTLSYQKYDVILNQRPDKAKSLRKVFPEAIIFSINIHFSPRYDYSQKLGSKYSDFYFYLWKESYVKYGIKWNIFYSKSNFPDENRKNLNKEDILVYAGRTIDSEFTNYNELRTHYIKQIINKHFFTMKFIRSQDGNYNSKEYRDLLRKSKWAISNYIQETSVNLYEAVAAGCIPLYPEKPRFKIFMEEEMYLNKKFDFEKIRSKEFEDFHKLENIDFYSFEKQLPILKERMEDVKGKKLK